MPYRLTTPKATKTRRASSEIRVRIPQTIVTLLLRTVLSFRPTATSHAFYPNTPGNKKDRATPKGSRNPVVLPPRWLGWRARRLPSEGAGRDVRVGSAEARRAALGP